MGIVHDKIKHLSLLNSLHEAFQFKRHLMFFRTSAHFLNHCWTFGDLRKAPVFILKKKRCGLLKSSLTICLFEKKKKNHKSPPWKKHLEYVICSFPSACVLKFDTVFLLQASSCVQSYLKKSGNSESSSEIAWELLQPPKCSIYVVVFFSPTQLAKDEMCICLVCILRRLDDSGPDRQELSSSEVPLRAWQREMHVRRSKEGVNFTLA